MTDPIVVLGSGLSGLVAARALQRGGRPVVCIDKGSGVGGRLATRRIGDATLDHGAQFFTVRSDEFQSFVDPLVATGDIVEWCRGFNEEDGFPRYRFAAGMNAMAKHLAAGMADVRTGITVTAIERHQDSWVVRWADGEIAASALVCTPPVPQVLALLDAGDTALDPAMRSQLDTIVYHRVLAVLATLDRPSQIPAPGGRQLSEGAFSFVADNQAKGLSTVPSITMHTNHTLSSELWDHDRDTTLRHLLDEASPWLGNASVLEAQLMAWRYSGPVTPRADHCLVVTDPGALVIAGDAFAGAKVEGAFLSGLAAAAALQS